MLDGLRDIVCDYVIEHLADDDAVLVIDETGFLKQGKASCGVARQYTGSAGKITNCQIGVFAAYVSRHGHAFVDRALYLPEGEWTDDPDRLEAAYVPPMSALRPNHSLRREWLHTPSPCLYHSSGLPAIRSTVLAISNSNYAGRAKAMCSGSAALTVRLQSWGKQRSVAGKAADIARTRRSSDWKRLSAGAGTKGTAGCMIGAILELADLEVEEFAAAQIKAFGHAVC